MIDIKTVKKNILSAAYQGNLSKVTDSTTNDLNKLHASLKKYKEVTDSEKLIETPSHWKWSRLGYISNNHGQKTPSDTFSYIDVGTLDNVHQRLSKEENIVLAKDAPSRARKIVEEGDVIYSTVRPYLHNICIIDKTFSSEPIASTAFCVMSVKSEVIINKFLFYWLLTPEFDKYANGDPSKGTLYPAIGEKDLLAGVIPIPPLEEQVEIVEIIEEAFNALSILDSAQSAYSSDLEVLKSKIIDAGIQGKLTEQLPEDGNAEDLYAAIQEEKNKFIKEKKIKEAKALPEITEDEIPFEIPDNWKWVHLGDLSYSIQYGYNAPAKAVGRIRMVRISDIQNGVVCWNTVPFCDIEEEDIAAYLLKENDILFARTGGTVGKSYIVSDVPEEAIFAGYLIRTSYSSKLSAKYMKFFMESNLYWKQLRNGTISTAQPNCNGQTLSKMIVPIPPFSEQIRIVEKIDNILDAIS